MFLSLCVRVTSLGRFQESPASSQTVGTLSPLCEGDFSMVISGVPCLTPDSWCPLPSVCFTPRSCLMFLNCILLNKALAEQRGSGLFSTAADSRRNGLLLSIVSVFSALKNVGKLL